MKKRIETFVKSTSIFESFSKTCKIEKVPADSDVEQIYESVVKVFQGYGVV